MNASSVVERRVRWCPAVAARLFGGGPQAAAVQGAPAAWRALLRDPAALSEARWAPLLDGRAGQGDESGFTDEAAGMVEATTAWAPRGATAWPPVPRGEPSGRRADPALSGEREVHRAPDGVTPLSATGIVDRLPPASVDRAAAPTAASQAGRPSTAATIGRRADASEVPPRLPSPQPWPSAGVPSAAGPGGASPLPHDLDGLLAAPRRADAAAGPVALPPSSALSPAAAPTRLVQGAAGLGRLLALVPRQTTHPAAGSSGGDSTPAAPSSGPPLPVMPAPLRSMPSAAEPSAWPAAVPLHRPPAAAPATADVDALLDALVERLRVDYLRHYGSAG